MSDRKGNAAVATGGARETTRDELHLNSTPRAALPSRDAAAIVEALEQRQGRREGGETRFLCPAHDDHDPSARWNPGKAVWHCDVCGTGGGAIDLARRLGVDVGVSGRGLTLQEVADAKGFTVDFLKGLGVTDGKTYNRPCVDIPYLFASGITAGVHKRVSLKTEPRFVWRKGDHPIPYGIPKLAEAKAAGYVVIVEGDSDAWTLWAAGLPALGIPGAGTWKGEWVDHLEGIPTVYCWREPDAGGDTLAPKVAASLPDVRIIEAPPDAKDPNAIWLALKGNVDAFRERMAALMATARPASELRAEALTAEARECFETARALLDDPNLIDRVGEAIRLGGFAGDLTPPLLAYLALTSRLTERPINLAFIAPSATGKSYAVDRALSLMPPTAYYLFPAGSERALIYNDEEFEHRTVVIGEADSIPTEGNAASAMRSLAADNRMIYEVTIRDAETGDFTTRKIDKQGPTGLMTTWTRTLTPEYDTRLLTVGVADTPQQTSAILEAHAASVNGSRPSVDTGALIALQRWLELAGERRVAVPFGDALAKAVPKDQIRMRRDFRQLLTAIQAVALLYQRQRQRDAEGRIIATPDDYAVARRLLLETFQTAATGGVSEVLRETVEAVNRLYQDGGPPLTVKAIGDALGLAQNTAGYRVRRAVKLGYLVNMEPHKGAPAKITPGEALPEYRPALPDVEVIMPLHLPETDCYVATPPSARIYAESEPTVQPPHCYAIATPLLPADGTTGCNRVANAQLLRSEDDFESENGSETATVQRSNANRGEVHTPPRQHPSPLDAAARSPLVQAALALDGVSLIVPETPELAEVRCHACGGTEFYFRADGSGPVCARCHPNPEVLAEDWRRERGEQ